MAGMPWFRLYSEILDDKKMSRICRLTGVSKTMVIGVWVCLLALANDSPERGGLLISSNMPYDLSDLANETEIPEDQLDILLKYFEEHDMLHHDNKMGWSILNWNGRQFKSDNVTARVRKYRERHTDDDNSDDSPNVPDDNKDADHSQYAKVWEQEIGQPIAGATRFYKMCDRFVKVGVTPEHYRTAIREQKKSQYAVKSPTSVETWAIGLVTGKDKAPVKSYDKEQLLKDVFND